MTLISFAAPVAHLFNTIQPDDSGVCLLALLAGVIGGWRLTGWHDQLKARRAKIQRDTPRTRKRD
ncbi:MAG TPA: hypothetical protein VFB37_13150 [Steroidobacteraceae bacterium]|nr:hypothetical protein [Steroidobacteraceae bacterium]